MSALALLAALGAAVVGGGLFAFSSFVMPALARLPPAVGIAAMQAINHDIIGSLYLLLFLALLPLSLGQLLAACSSTTSPAVVILLAAGAFLYAAGVFGLTIGYNVPRNEALAALSPDGAGSAEAWSAYLTGWTRGNHVRAVAALGAAACFGLAHGLLSRGR